MTMVSPENNVLERRLQLTIPLDDVRQETEKRLRKLARSVRIQGFRPGKVPYRMVVQQYGAGTEEEVINTLAQQRFSEEVRNQNLLVAGVPRFDALPMEEASQLFGFSATFEVYPQVTVGTWEGRVLEKTTVSVTDEDVERTLALLRQQRMTYHPVDRASAQGDKVLVDFSGTVDGEEFSGGKGEKMPVVLGSGRFLPEFEQGLLGLTAGLEHVFSLPFPENYPAANLAGKTATFTVSLKEVAEPVLPAIDDEFLSAVGVSSGGESQLRQELRDNLEREVRQKLRAQLKESVMSLLLEVAPIPVPHALIQREIVRMRAGMIEDMKSRNPKEKTPELPDSLFESAAKRRVALGLIVSELVRQQQISATPAAVRALIEELASAYEHPEDVIRWTYQNQEQLRQVEAVALEDAVVEWICTQVEIREIHKTFAELAQPNQDQ